MSGTLPTVVACLALGLSEEETLAVWLDLQGKSAPADDPLRIYRDLSQAIRKVRPSALPEQVADA